MTMSYRDRVLHVPSGEHVDYVGCGNSPDEVWVWFDGDSEPCTVPASDLQVTS